MLASERNALAILVTEIVRNKETLVSFALSFNYTFSYVQLSMVLLIKENSASSSGKNTQSSRNTPTTIKAT